MKDILRDDEQYITKTEMAVRMKVTTRTIDAWMAKGFVPFRKIGRTVRFHWPEVQDHLIARRRLVETPPSRQPGNGISGMLRQRAAEIRRAEAGQIRSRS